MTTTSERLKHLMRIRNLRQVDILKRCEPFSKKYGEEIRRNDLSQYVSGKVKPRQKKLTILSLALDVSEAWLMGYDVPEKECSSGDWIDSFRNYLNHILNTYSYADFESAYIDIERWRSIANGEIQITLSEACEIADAIGCSLDEMVGFRKASEFIELFSQLTEEQQNIVISQIKGILSNK